MLSRIKNWWLQWRCNHYTTATYTFIEDSAVVRETVCLQCAKRVPLDGPSLDQDVLLRMLEKSRAEKL